MNRLAVLLIGAALVCSTTVARANASNEGVEDHPWIGEAAPGFELQTTEGEKVSLAGLEGKIVIIHFGASW